MFEKVHFVTELPLPMQLEPIIYVTNPIFITYINGWTASHFNERGYAPKLQFLLACLKMDRYNHLFLYKIPNLVVRENRVTRTLSRIGNSRKHPVFLLVSPRLISAEVVEFRELGCNQDFFPVCPNCGITMEREYQSFCDRCGQKLAWNLYDQPFADEDEDFAD